MVHCAQLVAVLKVDGKVMREIRQGGSDVVFLPFGSEYEVCFNNLSPYRAAVSVDIDGKDALSGHRLVIDANSEGNLRGFMEADGSLAKNAFKFIKMSDKIAEHRGVDARDGLIRIEWQYEQPAPVFEPLPYPYPRPLRPVRPWPYRHPYEDQYGTWSCNSVAPDSGGEYKCKSSILRSQQLGQIGAASADSYADSDKGITAAGSHVNQKFGSTYLRSLFPEKHVIVFELRGETRDGQAVKSARTVKSRIACSTCGTKCGSGEKFCSDCGTCLI